MSLVILTAYSGSLSSKELLAKIFYLITKVVAI